MLLPHFFMVVVGKPGSGKTTIIERLLTRPGGYAGKFDYTFLVSPSKNKMGLPLP
jgi:ABC-type multidrug transport system ATPase subunit